MDHLVALGGHLFMGGWSAALRGLPARAVSLQAGLSGGRIDGMRRIVALALVMIGCGGDPPTKVGEFCDFISDAGCKRAIACGSSDTYDGCFQRAKTACCISDGSCGDDLIGISDYDKFKAICGPALASEQCSDLANGTTPAACLMQR